MKLFRFKFHLKVNHINDKTKAVDLNLYYYYHYLNYYKLHLII